jgi:hypothetical protein
LLSPGFRDRAPWQQGERRGFQGIAAFLPSASVGGRNRFHGSVATLAESDSRLIHGRLLMVNFRQACRLVIDPVHDALTFCRQNDPISWSMRSRDSARQSKAASARTPRITWTRRTVWRRWMKERLMARPGHAGRHSGGLLPGLLAGAWPRLPDPWSRKTLGPGLMVFRRCQVEKRRFSVIGSGPDRRQGAQGRVRVRRWPLLFSQARWRA